MYGDWQLVFDLRFGNGIGICISIFYWYRILVEAVEVYYAFNLMVTLCIVLGCMDGSTHI